MLRFNLLTSFCLLFFVSLTAQDFKGSEDHPLIQRYEGSRIVSYGTSNFAEYPIFLDAYVDQEPTKAEGAFTSINYAAPEGKSALEVHRNYELALEKAGFEKLFGCRQCGTYRYFDYIKVPGMPDEHYRGVSGQFDTGYYTAYKKGNTYVAILSGTGYDAFVHTAVDITEGEEMETGMVKVNADLIKEKLDADGKISIYGITFDTGKASIKPSSQSTLEAIAQFLQQYPEVSIYVIGHTDDTGSLEINLRLSKERALAVQQKLVNDFGVSSDRLTPEGIGPYAPVATNETDSGREKNRRVELVQRLK